MPVRELMHGDEHIRFLGPEMAENLRAKGLIVECSSCTEQNPDRTVYHVGDDAAICQVCGWPYALTVEPDGVAPELCPGCADIAPFRKPLAR